MVQNSDINIYPPIGRVIETFYIEIDNEVRENGGNILKVGVNVAGLSIIDSNIPSNVIINDIRHQRKDVAVFIDVLHVFVLHLIKTI